MNAQTLFSITGLPFSGKTTLTNKLVDKFGLSVISVDEIMERAGMWESPRPTDEDWNQAYWEAYQTLENLLKEGKNVIFDGGSLKKSERKAQRQIAEKLHPNYQLIYVNTSLKTIEQRRLKIQSTREHGQVDDQTMKNALKIWEEPTRDENPIVYSSKHDLDEWIEKYIGNIYQSGSRGR